MAAPGRIRRSIEVDAELLGAFDSYYPQRGALTWFTEEALRHFISIHTEGPSQMIREAVENVSGLDEET